MVHHLVADTLKKKWHCGYLDFLFWRWIYALQASFDPNLNLSSLFVLSQWRSKDEMSNFYDDLILSKIQQNWVNLPIKGRKWKEEKIKEQSCVNLLKACMWWISPDFKLIEQTAEVLIVVYISNFTWPSSRYYLCGNQA